MQHQNSLLSSLELLALTRPDFRLQLQLAAAQASLVAPPPVSNPLAFLPTVSSLPLVRNPLLSVSQPHQLSATFQHPLQLQQLRDNHLQQALAPRQELSKARLQGDRPLPPNWKPGPDSVIIGRKKKCYTSVGNLRLRERVLLSLPAYSKCTKKKDKTEIVTKLVETVRDSCPIGAFVKCDESGRWHEVSEVIARERVASIFRDFLSEQYKSSSRQKVQRRREKRVAKYGTEDAGNSPKTISEDDDTCDERSKLPKRPKGATSSSSDTDSDSDSD